MFKKILIIFGIFVVGGFFVLWLIGGKNLKTSVEALNLLALTNKHSASPEKKPVLDQDRDGIPDWEEGYRGTDPVKPNPSKDRNSDEVALTLIRQAQAEKPTPLISVDRFSGQGAKNYQLTDLKLIDNEENGFLKNYGQNLTRVIGWLNQPGLGYELPLVINAAETGEEVTAQIKQAADRYQQVITELLTLETPKIAGQIHLNLINNLSKLGYHSLLMSQIKTEPTLALAAANLHSSTLRQFLGVIANINLFFAGPTLSLENEARLNITLDV